MSLTNQQSNGRGLNRTETFAVTAALMGSLFVSWVAFGPPFDGIYPFVLTMGVVLCALATAYKAAVREFDVTFVVGGIVLVLLLVQAGL
jgi:hypothetical protein